jgi:uncharacterized oxidoreductase
LTDRLVEAQALEAWASRFLRAMGAPVEVAGEVARHLVGANLAGHDSHGVIRMPQYKAQADLGVLRPAAEPVIQRENGVCAIVDCGRGFGHFATMTAMDWCLDRAPASGIAAAAVRRSNHIGRLGAYAERAAARGLVGIATVGIAGPGAGLAAPFGGRQRFLGTNPWAIGLPARDRTPFVMDFASTNVAEGKVRVAKAKGAQLPSGVLIDSEGSITTDPDKLYEGGSLTPLGGLLAGHKGYGLALAAALVGGLAMIGDEDPTPAGTMSGLPPQPGWLAGAFTIALDPEWFGGRALFEDLVKPVLDAANSAPPAPGVGRVLVPGEPEAISRARRLVDGIPIPEPTWDELAEASANLGVRMPA